MTKTHLFFDLDNTVTRSRSKITPDFKKFLTETTHNVIMVSGATCAQITEQMDGVPCRKLGQNGNRAEDEAGVILWEEKLTAAETAEIHSHIDSLAITWEVSDKADMLQDRGCQVSYSLLGHNELLAKKEAFDVDATKRHALLTQYPFQSETLEVKIGGTTCLDYIAKGKHKGHHVDHLIAQMGWNKAECLYFGDMLFPGGNDESVIGVIETQAVDNPEDTLQKLFALE